MSVGGQGRLPRTERGGGGGLLPLRTATGARARGRAEGDGEMGHCAAPSVWDAKRGVERQGALAAQSAWEGESLGVS